MRKVLIVGLDSLPPYVLYEGNDGGGLAFTRTIVQDSMRYRLRSCHPPITVPAWMVMFTGKTPGELGIYGFRNRRPGEFEAHIVNSASIREPTLWDEAGKRGLTSIVFGVPPTYPPKPIHGYLVTDFTTPGPDKMYTFPPLLKREIENVAGKLIFDIVYRSEDKDRVRRDLLAMVKQHTRVMEYLLKKKKWDLAIYVEIGVDRAHHAFWRYFDERHPRYEYHEVYSRTIPETYRIVDKWLERITKEIPRDTIIVIASDHGVKPMLGAFTINEWLEDKGFLKLRKTPVKPGTDLREDMIDWSKTIAWAWGGYYSRVFVNLKGRERHGIVEPRDYNDVVDQLVREIMGVRGPSGEAWRNYALKPKDVFPVVRGHPPDLMVYLDDLNWRPAGTIGWNSFYLSENDRGPDDAVHDWYGVFAVYDPQGTVSKGYRGDIGIEKVKKVLEELLFEKR